MNNIDYNKATLQELLDIVANSEVFDTLSDGDAMLVVGRLNKLKKELIKDNPYENLEYNKVDYIDIKQLDL